MSNKKYRRNWQPEPQPDELVKEDVVSKEEVPPIADVKKRVFLVVNTKNLNVRSGPSFGDEVLFSVPNGTKFIPLSLSEIEEWAHIRSITEPIFEGYVMTNYTKLVEE